MRFIDFERDDVIKKAELSLTPMIDVVFLLLIFFIVGMKFKEFDRKLEADLPRAGKPPDDPEPTLINEIWVRIDDKNKGRGGKPSPKIVIDQVIMTYRRDESGKMTPWRHTYSTLQRLARAPQARDDPVILDPADAAQHGWVMTVLDYLRQLEYKNINFKQ